MSANSSADIKTNRPAIRVAGSVDDLTTEVELVLRQMFGQFSLIAIEAEFGRGYSGSRAFRVRLVDKFGRVHVPAVIKVADHHLIEKEATAYSTWVEGTLPNIARLEAPPTFSSVGQLGGLRYALVGGGTFEVQSLRDYYRQGDIDSVCWILEDRLFAIMGDNWWLDSRANRTFQMQADYDIFLPVNFSMKVSSISPERKTHFLEPDDGPLRPLSIGSQIALQGFVVDKIDPQDQEVTLNVPTVSPDEPFRSYRIRLEGVTDFTSYQRGKTIETVHGVITNTRQNLLYAQAVAALADTVDLTAERLPLPSGINLPNALWTYESMLSDFIPVRISTVHGDLNMENILVDSATRDVSLIDFATVRRGHALQDLLRLETEVMIMLLPPLLTAQKSLPQVIYDFYKLLHHMTLAPGWELSSSSLSPALTNPLKLILTIRKKAHNCLFDHNDWGEYYRGLTLYLLGALKLKGLDNSPVAPLPKQVAFWAAAALQHLLELPRLTGGPSILPIRPPVEATAIGQAIELESPYGTVQPDSGFYIERTADHQGWRELSRSEAGTLFVQAPRQMGKSSLLIRMKHRLEKELNKATVLIDFQKMPEHYFAEESSFYRELCLMIGEALALPEAIDRFWRGPRSVLIKCSRYLSDYLLPQVKRPVVLILDEVERMIDSPFRSDFFGMLRTWHNDRGTDPNFAKLSLLMSSSTEPYLLIDNLHQSPFNVAVPLVLSDFSQAEVAQLNERHSRSLSIEEVADLFELLGGHPFLTRLAFYEIASGKRSLPQLLAEVAAETGPFGNHLRYFMQRLSQRPELREALLQILRKQPDADSASLYRLESAGLIVRQGRESHFRNKLYLRYFQERLHG